MSVLFKCLPRPRVGVLHVQLVISGLDYARDLIEINLKKDNCFYQLHADGIVSLDLDFKIQFGDRLLAKTHPREGNSSETEALQVSFLELLFFFNGGG